MRIEILKVITLLFSFFIKRIKIKESVFLLNKVFIGKYCNVQLNNTHVSHLDIHLEGLDNKLIINGGYFRRGEIKIFGNGNVIEIGKDCNLSNLRIIVRGYNCRVTIGNSVTTGSAFIACMGKNNYVKIDDDCMLAEQVDIWATDSHGIYDINEKKLLNASSPVILKKHVWLGKNVSVLKGVTIGEGAIIGMKSLVLKDIPPYSLNVGSPSYTIKNNIYWERNFICE